MRKIHGTFCIESKLWHSVQYELHRNQTGRVYWEQSLLRSEDY